MNRGYVSSFAEDLNGMIDLKVSLGYAESTFADRSRQFDLFCAKNYPGAKLITEALSMSWLRMDTGTVPGTIHSRAAFLRGLARYKNAMGKGAYVLPDAYISGKRTFIPYLFSDDELSALFSQIDSYVCRRDPFRQYLFQAYFRLTYTCGLRPGEGRELKCANVDLKTGEIRILNTKWHKSRTVVMSDDMLSLAREYAAMRDAAYPNDDYFFSTGHNKPFTADTNSR